MQIGTPDYLFKRRSIKMTIPPLNVKETQNKLGPFLPIKPRPASPEKKPINDYISRIKNIYAPNTLEKSPHKSYRLHSKISIYRGKVPSSEEITVRSIDREVRVESKLKNGFEVSYDNQKFIVQTNKFNHPTVRIAGNDWQFKVREEIIKVFPMCINSSNGVSIVPSQNPNYIFYIGKGNNSDLIKRIFMSRPWWTQAEDDVFPNVNLAWTQILNTKFMHTVPLSEHNEVAISDTDLPFDISQLDTHDLGYNKILNSPSYVPLATSKVFASASIRMHNRLEFNYHLADKKYLYINMQKYYKAIGENVFDYLPLTFHIETNEDDQEFLEFSKVFEGYKAKKMLNLWIMKPGENCNRGNGICVCNTIDQIRNELKNNPFPKTGEHTFVIQKYIEKPFLISRRKFDIRLYCLVTSINGNIQAYYYQDGYIRTSCKEYNPKILDNKFIHLTNDAVQKKCSEYGKYEFANKMSYGDFQRYLDGHRPRVYLNFFDDVVPKMKKIVKDTNLAVFKKMDLRKRAHCFEVFGYDFLLDEHLKPWLIEVNTNPCLELASGLLATLIPAMMENAFRIAIDPLFQQPIASRRSHGTYFSENSLENKFELIFNEAVDGKILKDQLEQRRTLEDFLS